MTAKTRLTMGARSRLERFAEENVSCPKEQKFRDKAYAKAARMVSAIAEAKYPPADMLILEKYSVAARHYTAKGGSPDGRFVAFSFDKSDEAVPLAPNTYNPFERFSFPDKVVEAIEAFDKVNAELKTAKAEKLRNYKSLIQFARNFEDIVEVWPAVEVLRDKICLTHTAVVALSDDTVAFIKRDNAGAGAATEAKAA